jgi:hypothetical protein
LKGWTEGSRIGQRNVELSTGGFMNGSDMMKAASDARYYRLQLLNAKEKK